MSKPELKTAPAAKPIKFGDRVLYTPETTVGSANGLAEYLAFVGQIEEKQDGSIEYHLYVMPPFQKAQWFGNVRLHRPGEQRRGSFRPLSARAEVDEVPA